MDARRDGAARIAMLAAVAWVQAAAGQSFEGIGFLRAGDESALSGVSADGLTAVGAAYDPTGGTYGFGGYEAVRWTPDAGLEGLGLLQHGEGSWAFGASDDGSALAGGACESECLRAQPFRWLAPDGPLDGLGYLAAPAHYTYGYGISGDGAVVVGFGLDHAYDTHPVRWTEGEGIVAMERFPGGGAAFAYSASYDGSVIVGRGWDADGHEQAARWTAGGAIQGLGFLDDPGDEQRSLARAITPDGAVVVGTAHGADGRVSHVYQGFRWTEPRGMEPLGVEGPHGYLLSTAALDVSADASVLVGAWGGEKGTGDGSRAAVWHAGIGWRDLATWLADAHGLVEVQGWTLREATGISDDASVIVGWGVNPSGLVEGFIATVPASCAADFNGDGVADTRDVLAFLNAWAAGDARADIDRNGQIDTRDVVAFLNLWVAGC